MQAQGYIAQDYVKENSEEKYRARFREEACISDLNKLDICTLLGFSIGEINWGFVIINYWGGLHRHNNDGCSIKLSVY